MSKILGATSHSDCIVVDLEEAFDIIERAHRKSKLTGPDQGRIHWDTTPELFLVIASGVGASGCAPSVHL